MENKPILIQGAMNKEIDYLIKHISNIEKEIIDGYEFYKGELDEYPVIISKTNIGVIEASISTYIGITNFNPLFVINQGTAGACKEDIHLGDIVIGEKCININSFITLDKDIKQGSNSLEWKLMTFKEGNDELKEELGNKELINLVKDSLVECNNNFRFGIIGSGDVWDKEKDRIKWFNLNYKVLCEDMETIASYTVCNKLDIPVVGMRVISNNEILNEKFDKDTAIKLQEIIINLCKNIIKKLKEN